MSMCYAGGNQLTVGSLCAGELIAVTLMVMFMFSMTSLMLIASSFVTTELMMTMTYSLTLVFRRW